MLTRSGSRRRGASGRRRPRLRVLAPALLPAIIVAGGCADDGDEARPSEDDTPSAVAADGEAPADGSGDDGGSGGEDEEVEAQSFVTRPDLSPPVIDVQTAGQTSPGLLFLAPKRGGAQRGALIVDDEGEVVWARPSEDTVADFRVQTYQGKPVLTWFEGKIQGGFGRGEYVIADSAYRDIARVAAGSDHDGDHHEFRLTDEGTALITIYNKERVDLSGVGGPQDGWMINGYLQEIDIATGEVLLEWSAYDHVPIAESTGVLVPDAGATDDPSDDDGTEKTPYDWFHINSVAEDGDDGLLVSARYTDAIYSIDRRTGEVRWTLGGKGSDFAMGEGAEFVRQHDAQRLSDGTISLFDNQAHPPDNRESRGLVLAVDEGEGTATVVREWRHPDGVRATSQANTQVLPGGGAVIGWGSVGRVTEFDAGGAVVFDATWMPGNSYRAYRHEWTGRPITSPDAVARPVGGGDGVEVYASWNGATEVVEWRVLGGPEAGDLEALATVTKDGFETRVEIDAVAHVAVEALDASGTVLATSGTVAVAG
ncbi:MAG TPA: arylsulfotransferase family protein [Acidimicrobiales bacterium]